MPLKEASTQAANTNGGINWHKNSKTYEMAQSRLSLEVPEAIDMNFEAIETIEVDENAMEVSKIGLVFGQLADVNCLGGLNLFAMVPEIYEKLSKTLEKPIVKCLRVKKL